MVAPEHAAQQALFQSELTRVTEQRRIAEERKAALERARDAEARAKAGAADVSEMFRNAVPFRSPLQADSGYWQHALSCCWTR